MLPDTLHKLPQEERFAYAKVLAFMTRVDDELTVDEMAMFEQRLGTALLSPNQRKSIRSALKVPPPLEECLQELGPEAGRLALRDSVLMAAADGNVDEDELEEADGRVCTLSTLSTLLEPALALSLDGSPEVEECSFCSCCCTLSAAPVAFG